MATRGKHVLIVEDDSGYQQVFDLILQHTGRWSTVAENGDEAMAILRSTLHPLIVIVNGSMRIDGGEYGSLALSLLANPDFAWAHAFILHTDRRSSGAGDADALREEVARLSVGFVAWLETPPGLRVAFTKLNEAEEYLTSRG